ncbi:hypothetical protein FB45DRAFT_907257 [Roridomyces roridus]|uniref:Uncharacterized protein n=1 Tax=Roridomyces roridus TaxID=1738132 RepID=A0AAD7C1J1_9AGAR|nr:hypothetical protein FB45DRAFT_907257 [Roridomyces roridus]
MLFPPPGPVEARFQSCANVVVPTEAENHGENAEAEVVVGTCGGSRDMYMSVVPGAAIDDSSRVADSDALHTAKCRALSPSSDAGLDGMDWYPHPTPEAEMYGQALVDEIMAPGMKQRFDKLEEDAGERAKAIEARKAGTLYDFIFALLEEGENSLAGDNDAESEYSWTASSDFVSPLFVAWGQENATEDSDVDVLDKAGRNQWDHLVIEDGALAGPREPQTSGSAQEMRNEYCETLEEIINLLQEVDAVVESQ